MTSRKLSTTITKQHDHYKKSIRLYIYYYTYIEVCIIEFIYMHIGLRDYIKLVVIIIK